MIEFVIKKDLSRQAFDPEKIKNGIFKSVRAAGGSDKKKSDEIAQKVLDKLKEKYKIEKEVTSNQILDIVEEVLIKGGHDRVSREFILHRYRAEMFRKPEETSKDNILMKEYLDKSDWRVKENANMAYSLQGLNYNIASKVTANYWLTEIYSPDVARSHVDGDFHIHDLGILGAYCVGWSLQDLLSKGFTGVPQKITCKPAKHLRTALGQMVNFIYTLQGESAGAQAFSNVDTLLAPFIKIDKLEKKQVKQAVQEFVFNMSVPTRVGFQNPFSNLSFDLTVPHSLADKSVIVGGEVLPIKYSECQAEMDLFNDVFWEVLMEGDGAGRVFTFPIPTYNITKDFNWNSSKYEKLWKITAKYGIPYFANYINSDMDPEQITSMCCRLKIDRTHLEFKGGGLFGAGVLTGSIGVVTINMPRLGYLSKSDEEFFDRLGKLMDLAKESLITKRRIIEDLTAKGLYPYAKFYLADIKEDTGEYWKNHFSTIGLVGMNEALLNMKKSGIVTKEGNELAQRILNFMREKLKIYQGETKSLWNLEATPAEGTSYRLARIDKRTYPDIIVANEKNFKKRKAPPYYTNSTQFPVDTNIDLFKALELQDPLQILYTGGTVFHTFLGEAQANPESIKKLVKKIAQNYKLPYFSITPSFSICPIHNYIPGEHKFCPICATED